MRFERVRFSAIALQVLLVVVAACSSGVGGQIGDWSRTYAVPDGRVFEACLDSLEAIDFFLVEVDEVKGRIRAEASASRGEDLGLLVRVAARASGTRVDVMAQGAALQPGRQGEIMDSVIAEFLRDLDARLEGRAG